MAAYTGALVAASLSKIYPELFAVPFRNCLLPQILPVVPGGGQGPMFTVKIAGDNNSGAVADGAAISTYSHDDYLPAQGVWARYSDAIKITGDALDMAASDRGIPDEERDQVQDQWKGAMERIAAGISAHSYTGTGTSPQEINGLYTGTTTGLLGTTGSSVYGLNRGTTAASWIGNVLRNGGIARPFTPKLLQSAFTAMQVAQGSKPDVIITTPALLDSFSDSFTSDRRYTADVTVAGRKIVLDGGYMGLMHNGVPLIGDVHCPAGCAIGINLARSGARYVQLTQRTDPFVGATMKALRRSPTDAFPGDGVPLTVKVIPHGIAGDYVIFQALWKGQLKVKGPNHTFVLADLV